jgi:hypothetical protein
MRTFKEFLQTRLNEVAFPQVGERIKGIFAAGTPRAKEIEGIVEPKPFNKNSAHGIDKAGLDRLSAEPGGLGDFSERQASVIIRGNDGRRYTIRVSDIIPAAPPVVVPRKRPWD